MNDLLKSQLHENCKLALPEGLKDLMSDISREVLRAQPSNLYQFIANYLKALLEARETLTIACQVCTDLCKCTCEQIKPELYNELKKIGLHEEEIENAIDVIEKHLSEAQRTNEPFKEQSLLLKLIRKTDIDDTQLPAIQQAVRKTLKRFSLDNKDLTDFQYENNKEPMEAVQHTLKLYNKQNKPFAQNESKEMYVAPNFQAYVNTVSSTTVAGSYVELPKYRPYSAHDCESLAEIPEKEHLLIDYIKVAETTNSKTNRREIDYKKTDSIENNDKYKANELFDDNNVLNQEGSIKNLQCLQHNKTGTRTSFKLSNITVSEETAWKESEEMNEDGEFSDVYNDIQDEEDIDEVQEDIENIESENDSQVSSITESIKDDIE